MSTDNNKGRAMIYKIRFKQGKVAFNIRLIIKQYLRSKS